MARHQIVETSERVRKCQKRNKKRIHLWLIILQLGASARSWSDSTSGILQGLAWKEVAGITVTKAATGKNLGFTKLHLQNHRLLKSPGSYKLPQAPTRFSFLTRQISMCYFTTVLQPGVMHLGTRGSDFATVGLKEIQMISSATHSTEQNSGVFDSASLFLDVKCPVS